ncbi:hypothetical protein BD413DRAFT_283274 [Trametes elegans]|nr:hypothetical protein BD413DRAFT_283274 [Trametes elegans]
MTWLSSCINSSKSYPELVGFVSLTLLLPTEGQSYSTMPLTYCKLTATTWPSFAFCRPLPGSQYARSSREPRPFQQASVPDPIVLLVTSQHFPLVLASLLIVPGETVPRPRWLAEQLPVLDLPSR